MKKRVENLRVNSNNKNKQFFLYKTQIIFNIFIIIYMQIKNKLQKKAAILISAVQYIFLLNLSKIKLFLNEYQFIKPKVY